jgi:hypothetical protein
MGAPTGSYATAGIALRVSGALKPHHHDKVETQSVRMLALIKYKNSSLTVCMSNAVFVIVRPGFEMPG